MTDLKFTRPSAREDGKAVASMLSPGTIDAAAAGCTCPPNYDAEVFAVRRGCPMHGREMFALKFRRHHQPELFRSEKVMRQFIDNESPSSIEWMARVIVVEVERLEVR